MEFLNDDPILAGIAAVFLQIPDDLSGFAGITGKRYDAIKDACKWHGYKKKTFVPVFWKMGEEFARGVHKNAKNTGSHY